MEDMECTNAVYIVDSLNILTKDGFNNLCSYFGEIKNLIIYKKSVENCAFVEFENEESACAMIRDKLDLPSFITVNFSKKFERQVHLSLEKEFQGIDINDDNSHSEASIIVDEKHSQFGKPLYFGPRVSESSLIEEYKLMKPKPYNLGNDYLFGQPLNAKWEKINKPEFKLHKLDFYYRFENCLGGKIKIEKMLSPNTCTGWATLFNDGENVQDKLENISNDIECSDILNINDWKLGMLVGAYDSATKLYGRGYVTVIADNSVNVVMSDYGKVINTNQVRVLPKILTEIPIYSFKVFTKVNSVQQLKEKLYTFSVYKASAERIVLNIIDSDKEIKIQLKKWQPTVEEYGVPYIEFKNGSPVELLKLKDMSSVYLKSTYPDDFEFFFHFWDYLSSDCQDKFKPLIREPLYGEIIGYKSKMTKNYVRGRIHKYFGDNTYSVKQMNEPLKEIIKLSEMIELPFEQKNFPVGYIKVALKMALPYPIQFETRNFVNFLIGERLILRFDESRNKGWKQVNLIYKYTNDDTQNIFLGLIEPSWLKDNLSTNLYDELDSFCKYEHLLYNELKEKTAVKMKFVLYHEGVFYMRDKLFGRPFSVLNSMIKEYCGLSLHSYLPHIGEVCLGQFPDGAWYRVICDKLKPGELAKVHAIDFGNVAYLNSQNIRKLPIELMFHPCHVYLCILNTPINIGDHVFEKKTKILQTYENTDCEITIVKKLYGKNHYLINCKFIEDLIK